MEADVFPPRLTLKKLEKLLAQADSYEEWRELAKQHDFQSGAEGWKEELRCNLYDFNEVKSRYDTLKRCMEGERHRELLYALNEGVHGNMGGMGRPVLYTRAKFGTKKLIEDYVSTIADALPDVDVKRLAGHRLQIESDHPDAVARLTTVFGKKHVKIGLYDPRENSGSKGATQTVYIGERNHALVTVPPGVWNGFMNIDTRESIVANCATIPHDPGEISRVDPHENDIPYSWSRKDG